MIELSVVVSVLFSSDVVHEYGNSSFLLSEIGEVVTEDVMFRPNDPHADDAELRRYYSAEISSAKQAQELVDYLTTLPGVDAAWVRPREEAPE